MRSSRFPAIAIATGLLALLVVFFPTLFFGDLISPQDTVFSAPPWRAELHPVEVTNPELAEPASALLPLAAAAHRDGLSTAVWNPYLSAGAPGTATWSNGLLTPAVLPFLPWLDPALLPNAMVLVKLLLSLAGMFLFLRSLGLEETAASVGAAAFALAGPLTTSWLWPASATWAALPLLLWALDRTIVGDHPWRKVPAAVAAWLVFLSGGSPGATVLGAYVAFLWVGFRLLSLRKRAAGAARSGAAAAAALVLATAVLAPSLGLFAVSARATGALGPSPVRTSWGSAAGRLLVDPFAFGDPRHGDFDPPPWASALRFRELTLTSGIVVAALALIGLASRRRPTRFWGIVLAGGVAVLAWAPLARLVFSLPGLAHVETQRGTPVLALAAAVLAAAGVQTLREGAGAGTLRRLTPLFGVAVVLEMGLFAGHSLAFLPRDRASLPWTRGLGYLSARGEAAPTRVAPLLDALVPDTAQEFGLEDLRSKYASTTGYRRWLRAIDPQAWGHFGRALRLNAATIDLGHPYLAALGARWVVEDPSLHLVEFSLGANVIDVERRTAELGPLSSGDVVVQELRLPAGCSRLAIRAATRTARVAGRLDVTLLDEALAAPVARWMVDADELVANGQVWLPVPGGVTDRHRYRLTIAPRLTLGRVRLRRSSDPDSLDGRLVSNGRPVPGDLALSFDVSGYVLAYEGRDLRIWENRRAAPRFGIVRSILPGNLDTLLAADPPLDLTRTATVDAEAARQLTTRLSPPTPNARERLSLISWEPGGATLEASLAAPAVLVSSVPFAAPLWNVRIDGATRPPLLVNGIFLGAELPAGKHAVTVEARIPGSWYAASMAGGAGWLVLLVAFRRRRGDGAREALA